ncbi:MAG: amino terminal protease self-immunity [Spartobacteria bacterium]|nr:amino terminal protease self-immunity [Spartobacteria bacterium]
MSSQSFFSALGYTANVLFLFAGLYVYVSLIRQISARQTPPPEELPKRFGLPEAIIAAFLMSLLLLNVAMAASAPAAELNTRDLVANLVVTVMVVLILVGFLTLRGFHLDALAGFSKLGIVRAIGTGALLLLAAYPLIVFADLMTRHFIGNGSARQNIVELFNGSHTMPQRVMIIVLAVAVAPVAEEFVFRFFLYGVLRRYLGRFVGLVVNALLFAAVHQHLPSFGPLFVLGACFTLAYEWSGSLLVPMTMHSLFNSLSLLFLAFPDISQQ